MIENVDPLTTGQIMHGEDIQSMAGITPQPVASSDKSQHNPGLPVPGSSDKPNKSKLEQIRVAKIRQNIKG